MGRSGIQFLCALVLLLTSGWSAIAQTTAASTQPAAVVVLEGQIDDYTRNAMFRRIEAARAAGAKTIILEINTWGGQVSSALNMSQYIKRQDDLHIIGFVRNEAISAGAMIALACDELVMQPNARLGDCAPIMVGDNGLQPMPAAERAKMESPILADFRESARRNGYDPLLVESMVTVDRVVHFIQNPQGDRRFVNDLDFKQLTTEGWVSVPGISNPVDREGELLTVDSDLAVKLGLAKAIANSPDALAAERGLTITSRYASGAGEKIVDFLTSPVVRMFLMSIFSVSLYIALSQPGHGAPEAIALITLSLVLGIPLLTGYAQRWEIIVIFAGLSLIAFELFVFPGHFVSLIVGGVLMIGGLVMTFVPKEPTGLPGILPALSGSWDALTQGVYAVGGALIASILLWFWLARYLPTLPYFNRLVLVGDATDSVSLPPAPQSWPVLGQKGTAVTDLRPGGTGSFFDASLGDHRTASVVTDRGFIAAGTELKIVEINGNRVVVRPTEAA